FVARCAGVHTVPTVLRDKHDVAVCADRNGSGIDRLRGVTREGREEGAYERTQREFLSAVDAVGVVTIGETVEVVVKAVVAAIDSEIFGAVTGPAAAEITGIDEPVLIVVNTVGARGAGRSLVHIRAVTG